MACMAEEEEEWPELAPFCLFSALKLVKPEGGEQISGARVRTAFHRIAPRIDPDNWTRFRQVTLAFSVLKSAETSKIYTELGYDALVRSEEYAEWSVFDLDPMTVYNDFFEGVDEEDREYLLMNGAAPLSEEEESEEDEDLVGVARHETVGAQPVHSKLQDSDDGPPVPPDMRMNRRPERKEPDPWAEISANVTNKRTRAERGQFDADER
eukprot:TRINITY_DN14827_c0_g1_i1.p1 TRINITY_DN14827_c0_g1~~TRINITY_DN14827_c0_g1_i1.p1  ORF type:complete len:210 (-),score=45.55 TRINITY_DN14827_c0_g1_i1:325-954(-)